MVEHIGKEFMRKTCCEYLSESPQARGLPPPPLQIEPSPHDVLLPLPAPVGLAMPALDLRVAIERRVSVRQYRPEPLAVEELTLLLWLTQGVKKITAQPATLRTVPSAGGRHAFETYLLLNRVQGLPPGVYRYAALQHALVQLEGSLEAAERLEEACRGQKMITRSAAVFCWAAVVERMAWRHVERSYRYLHLDAGHVCQNLYLAAEALDCGVCAIAVFEDEQVNQLFGLDGEEQFVIYLAAVGKK